MNTFFSRLAGRDLRGWVLPLALLAAWWLATRLHWVDTRLIVPPAQVAATAWSYLSGAEFGPALRASLFRDLSGFVAGSAAGIGFGLLLALSAWAERLIGPTFHAFKQISLFAWIPLLSIWLGYTDQAKILFIAVSAFYPVALNTFEGVRSVSRTQIEVARVYGLDRRQLTTRLILPAASPQILAGLHLALIYAWLATVGAEFLLRSYGAVGLGETVIKGRAGFHVDLVVFGMFIIGAVGSVLNAVAARAEAYLLRWRGRAAA